MGATWTGGALSAGDDRLAATVVPLGCAGRSWLAVLGPITPSDLRLFGLRASSAGGGTGGAATGSSDDGTAEAAGGGAGGGATSGAGMTVAAGGGALEGRFGKGSGDATGGTCAMTAFTACIDSRLHFFDLAARFCALGAAAGSDSPDACSGAGICIASNDLRVRRLIGSANDAPASGGGCAPARDLRVRRLTGSATPDDAGASSCGACANCSDRRVRRLIGSISGGGGGCCPCIDLRPRRFGAFSAAGSCGGSESDTGGFGGRCIIDLRRRRGGGSPATTAARR